MIQKLISLSTLLFASYSFAQTTTITDVLDREVTFDAANWEMNVKHRPSLDEIAAIGRLCRESHQP